MMSRFSRWHLSITPSECVDCRLCETSCPFDYIDKPNTGLDRESREAGVKRLSHLFIMLPILVALGGWIGHRLSIPMSSYNMKVYTMEQILAERQNPDLEQTLYTETFDEMGLSEDALMEDALLIRKRMNMGGWLLGGFMGLVFGVKLIGISTIRSQKDYEVVKPSCFSCARCCGYCPSDDMHKPNFVPGTAAYNEALALADPANNPQPEKKGAQEAKV